MHTPVLINQVLEHFENIPGSQIIDCTLGEGGHTLALASRGAKMLSIDADESQLLNFHVAHKSEIDNLGIITTQANYKDIKSVAIENGFDNCDGIIFDLGLSMHQINTGEGFSYKHGHQPLHMVIDTMCKQKGAAGAADVLAYKSEGDLVNIFEKYGGIESSTRIARSIVNARSLKKIETVSDLIKVLEFVEKVDLARVFQALRIYVNKEYENITMGLNGAWDVLKTNGVLQIITFHSGEDRIVKLWSKGKKSKKVVGRKLSQNKFEKSAVLRILKKD